AAEHRSVLKHRDLMPRAAPFPNQDCVGPDSPHRHDLGWLAHAGIFGDALQKSAGGRLETTQRVLLDAVRDRPPEPVPAQMKWSFDFVEKLPLGSQLIQIKGLKTDDFCREPFTFLVGYLSHGACLLDRWTTLLCGREQSSRRRIEASKSKPATTGRNLSNIGGKRRQSQLPSRIALKIKGTRIAMLKKRPRRVYASLRLRSLTVDDIIYRATYYTNHASPGAIQAIKA